MHLFMLALLLPCLITQHFCLCLSLLPPIFPTGPWLFLFVCFGVRSSFTEPQPYPFVLRPRPSAFMGNMLSPVFLKSLSQYPSPFPLGASYSQFSAWSLSSYRNHSPKPMTILNSSQFGNLVRDGGGGRPGILTPGLERQTEPTLGHLAFPQLEIWRLGFFNLGAGPDSPQLQHPDRRTAQTVAPLAFPKPNLAFPWHYVEVGTTGLCFPASMTQTPVSSMVLRTKKASLDCSS